MKKYWLMKTEPETYSWDDLIEDGKTSWDGVRNYQARNHLKETKVGDEVLIYHSVSEKSVVGVAKVVSKPYPDLDPKRKGEWVQVDIEPLKPLTRPVSLKELKEEKKFKDLPLITHSRLSVMPIPKDHFAQILKMGNQSE